MQHGMLMAPQKAKKPFPSNLTNIELQFDMHFALEKSLEVTEASLSKISSQLKHPVVPSKLTSHPVLNQFEDLKIDQMRPYLAYPKRLAELPSDERRVRRFLLSLEFKLN